eukprot:130991-Pleurochrysis_carterae.AAC.1
MGVRGRARAHRTRTARAPHANRLRTACAPHAPRTRTTRTHPSEFDGRIFLNVPPLSVPSPAAAAPSPAEAPQLEEGEVVGSSPAVSEEATPMEESEIVQPSPAVAEAPIVEPSPASAEETRDSEDTGLCEGYELADKYPPLRHFATSVPINHYRRYDGLDWPTYQEDVLTFVYDVRRETAPPSRLVAELHRAH